MHRHGPGIVPALVEAGEDLAAGAEVRVQAAVGVVAGEGDVVVAYVVGIARGDDLPVRLQRHGKRLVGASGKVGPHLAAGAEAGVQAAVRVAPNDEHVIPSVSGGGRAHGDDLPVRLDRHGVGIVVASGDAGQHLAVGVEGGVQAAVGVVTGQGQVVVAGPVVGVARGNDLPVRLELQPAVSTVVAAGEVGEHPAVGVEVRIEAAVGVVTGEGEVVGARVVGGAGGHDLPVGLDRHAVGAVGASGEVGQDLAAGAEARVQAPVRVVTCQGKVGVAVVGPVTGHDDFSVRLDRRCISIVIPAAHVGQDPAVPVKAGVQAPVRVVTNHGKLARATGAGRARHHDLPVTLNDDGAGVARHPHTGRDRSSRAEVGVQGPIHVVAGDAEGPVVARAGDHQLAVRLARDGVFVVRARRETRRHPAALAEDGIGRARIANGVRVFLLIGR